MLLPRKSAGVMKRDVGGSDGEKRAQQAERKGGGESEGVRVWERGLSGLSTD